MIPLLSLHTPRPSLFLTHFPPHLSTHLPRFKSPPRQTHHFPVHSNNNSQPIKTCQINNREPFPLAVTKAVSKSVGIIVLNGSIDGGGSGKRLYEVACLVKCKFSRLEAKPTLKPLKASGPRTVTARIADSKKSQTFEVIFLINAAQLRYFLMLASIYRSEIGMPFSSMDLKLHSHGLYQTLRSTVLNVSGYSKDFCVMEPFGDDNASVKELKDYESRLVILIGNSGTIDLLDDHGLKLISESRRQQNLPPLRPHWQ
ncbi:hypothetical protein DKX38_006398 [Salix brachista]|uniref:Uncharacterized protein n=1 Tax=Salix brachista TaxID=2182728 RepID=A0A5N5N4Q0_9ROSI|nr:hypothetical protein DKX38_006398 [Salix brachista]